MIQHFAVKAIVFSNILMLIYYLPCSVFSSINILDEGAGGYKLRGKSYTRRMWFSVVQMWCDERRFYFLLKLKRLARRLC